MLPQNSQNNSWQDMREIARPSIAFVVIIFGALIAFEIFNFSTTEHALMDLLGGLTFAGIPWSTVLAIAFCGIDFAGIARLFTPEQGMNEPKEVWYLFGAWLLAATMNAILTWWGVSMAVMDHTVQSSAVVDPSTINSVVPVFVAVMVWVIRILIIGTLSLAMDRLMHPGAVQRTPMQVVLGHSGAAVSSQTTNQSYIPNTMGAASIPQRNSVVPRTASGQPSAAGRYQAGAEDNSSNAISEPSVRRRGEPSYHTINASPRPGANNGQTGGERFRRS